MSTKVTKHRGSKRDKLVHDLAANYTPLGEVVCWTDSANHGKKNSKVQVVAALQTAGLDDKVAKDFSPAQAFNRAITTLADEDRIIKVIRKDSDEVLFQFTKTQITDDLFDGDQQLDFHKETKVRLDKNSGKLTCPDPDILVQAEKELQRCLEERTTTDISTITTTLFEKHSVDLIPIGNGVFFVPQEHVDFVDKIHHFYKDLGRHLTRLPIPKGTTNGDQSVQEAMERHFTSLVGKLDKAVSDFSLSTRATTIEETAGEIAALRDKVGAYATYLQDKSEELAKKVDYTNRKLLARVMQLEEERKTAPPEARGSNRQRVWSVLNGEAKSVKQLCQEAGVSPNGIGAYLDSLVAKGTVARHGGGYKKVGD